MTFQNFAKKIDEQFAKMQQYKLFVSKIEGSQLWDLYLQNMNEGIFRDPSSSIDNCKLCNNFIRKYGNIVAIDPNLNIVTMWDVEDVEQYQKLLMHFLSC